MRVASASLITRIHHVTLPFRKALLLRQGCQRLMKIHRVVGYIENVVKYTNIMILMKGYYSVSYNILSVCKTLSKFTSILLYIHVYIHPLNKYSYKNLEYIHK